MTNKLRCNVGPYAVGFVFIILMGIATISFLHEKKYVSTVVITDDIAKLADIFKNIHDSCNIMSFDYLKNPINFLTVKAFVGSEIGSMNLAHPEQWQGPYVQDNPAIQGKEYLVVRTKQGHFITPGEAVTLPNGKVIGVDIILTEDVDLEALAHSEDGFLYEGRSLVVKLPF